jgi:hypothetical protein
MDAEKIAKFEFKSACVARFTPIAEILTFIVHQ